MTDREMDALVASKVMGHQIADSFGIEYCFDDGYLIPIPRYSTDIAAAWLVVERMHASGYWMKMVRGEDGAFVGFTRFGVVHCGSSWVQAEEKPAPMAICKAALHVVDAEELILAVPPTEDK